MAVATAPHRNHTATREQSMEALARANEIRLGRAEIKRELRARKRSMLETLAAPPREIETARVVEILCSMHRWGPARVKKLMREAMIGQSRTVGDLTDRERTALIARLRRARVS